MILGVHHIAISTPDAERLAAFYVDKLGFAVRFDHAWEPGTQAADNITGLRNSAARQMLLAHGNLYLELFEYRSPSPRRADPMRPVCDHGLTHLCLDVEDLDVEYVRLRAAGVTFHCPPQDVVRGTGIRTTYARDPDGNVVELQELAGTAHPFAVPGAAAA